MILGVKEGTGTRSKGRFSVFTEYTYILSEFLQHASCFPLKYINEKHSLNTHLLYPLYLLQRK